MRLKHFAIGYLLVQGIGASLWWCFLFLMPSSRVYFMVKDAPEVTLLAFALPDVLLFIGASFVCAYGFTTNRSWAWPMLCVHAGAAGYAAWYCIGLTLMTWGDGLLGTIIMSPCMVVVCWLAIKLKPRK